MFIYLINNYCDICLIIIINYFYKKEFNLYFSFKSSFKQYISKYEIMKLYYTKMGIN